MAQPSVRSEQYRDTLRNRLPRGLSWLIVFSAVVHVGAFFSMAFGESEREQPKVQTYEIVQVDIALGRKIVDNMMPAFQRAEVEGPDQPATGQERPEPQRRDVVPEPVREEPDQEAVRRALEREKRVEEQQRRREVRRERQRREREVRERRRAREEERRRKQEEERQARMKRLQEIAQNRAAQARRQGRTNYVQTGDPSGTAGGSLSAAGLRTLQRAYFTQVYRAINWKIPETLPQSRYRGLRCVIEFELTEAGIISNPRFKQRSGNQVFDGSAMAAVRSTRKLPLPPHEDYRKAILRTGLALQFDPSVSR